MVKNNISGYFKIKNINHEGHEEHEEYGMF